MSWAYHTAPRFLPQDLTRICGRATDNTHTHKEAEREGDAQEASDAHEEPEQM